MQHDWLTNDKLKGHVKQVLTQTGFPLETQVAQICRRFVHFDTTNIFVTTSRVVYSPKSNEEQLREIDQVVMLDAPPVMGMPMIGNMNVSFQIHVPIECKHRDGLQIFGFPDFDEATPDTAEDEQDAVVFPLFSDLAHTNLAKTIDTSGPSILGTAPRCTVGLLKREKDTFKRFEEQLFYNSTGALYDYIRHGSTSVSEPDIVDPLLKDLGIIDQFVQYLDQPIGGSNPLNMVRKAWLWSQRHLKPDVRAQFYDQHIAQPRVSHPIFVWLPILCVDAPIYLVQFDQNGTIQDFEPRQVLLTNVRLPQWPGVLHPYLVEPMREALVAIVNVVALENVLQGVHEWLLEIEASLQDVDERTAQRAPIEAAFMRSIRAMYPSNIVTNE